MLAEQLSAGQAAARQNPSSQMPEAQALGEVQLWPLTARQMPLAVHVLSPLQVFVEVKAGTFSQVPEAHVWQLPLQALLQQ